jgi:F-type H+-transporting ATPase subunit b
MLKFDPITLVITFINLVVLFFVLKAILFKPVTKFVAARAARIREDLDRAAQDRAAANALIQTYQAKLKSAANEADAITAKARAKADARAATIIAQAQSEAKTIIATAKQQAISEQQAAALVFRAQAANLVLQATSKVLRHTITGEAALQLANQALNELSAAAFERKYNVSG